MDKKEEYRERLEAQLKEWKAKIDTLETRGTKFTAETKNDLMREIEELRLQLFPVFLFLIHGVPPFLWEPSTRTGPLSGKGRSRSETDQRFVEIQPIAFRESVVGAFQYKTSDLVADHLFHEHFLRNNSIGSAL